MAEGRPSPDPVRGLAAPAAGALLLALLSVGWWAGLYEARRTGLLLGLALLASLPGLAALAPRRRELAIGAGLAIGLLGVAAVVTGHAPWAFLAASRDAWGDLARVVPEGLAAGGDASTPASVADEPEFVRLLDLALAALVGGGTWLALARGRAAGAVVVAGVGIAYRWTVEAPASPLVAGCVALAGMLAALALVGGRSAAPATARRAVVARPGTATRAVVALAAVIAVAAVAGTGPAHADQPWWDWRTWGAGGGASAGALDVQQNYGQLRWPEVPREVMRVRTSRPLPMRALALEAFDGAAFTWDQSRGSVPVRPDAAGVAALGYPGSADSRPIEERVTLQEFEAPLVPLGGRALEVRGDLRGQADLVAGDGLRVTPPLGPGARYTALVVTPDPDPAALVAARRYDPSAVPPGATDLRAGRGGPTITVPVWGSGGIAPDDAELGDYAQVRALARRVAGDARSPYVAVNRIETYLRSDFAYDEAPPFPPPGTPPLVDFLFRTHRGFCQQFAGSMGVMLRSLGIPSRVAVGYTQGRLDPQSGEWVIVDRDAHSWVEVWLPDAGWVAFDPTPGRYAPNRVSVGSPDYAPPAASSAGAEVTPAPVRVPQDAAPAERPAPARRAEPAPRQASATGAPAPSDGRQVPWPALAALALLTAAVSWAPARRTWGRRRGRGRGGERDRVLAALADLEASLTALGADPPRTEDAAGRARELRARFGVDARALYAAAESARYARDEPAPGAADAAWRDAARVRRQVAARIRRRRRVAAFVGLPPARRATLAR